MKNRFFGTMKMEARLLWKSSISGGFENLLDEICFGCGVSVAVVAVAREEAHFKVSYSLAMPG